MTNRINPVEETEFFSRKVDEYRVQGETIEEAERLARLELNETLDSIEFPEINNDQLVDMWS